MLCTLLLIIGFKEAGAAEVGGQGGHLPTQFSAKSCNKYLVCERKKLTCNPNCMLDF